MKIAPLLPNNSWACTHCLLVFVLFQLSTPGHSQTSKRPPVSHSSSGGLAATLRPSLVPQLGHANEVVSVRLSPDGKLLASASVDGTVKLWDLVSRRLIQTFFAPPRYDSDEEMSAVSIPTSMSFSPDGKLLAVGDTACRVIIWEILTGKQRATLIDENIDEMTDHIRDLSFSSNGATVTVLYDEEAQSWNVAARKSSDIAWAKLKHDAPAVIGRDATALAYQSDSGIEIRTTEAGKFMSRVLPQPGHVSSLALSSKGDQVAIGEQDHAISVWDLATNTKRCELRGHREEVRALAFSLDGQLLASGAGDDDINLPNRSVDNTVRVWDLNTCSNLMQYCGSRNAIDTLAFSKDGNTLAAAGREGKIYLLDLKQRGFLDTLPGRQSEGVTHPCVSNAGNVLATSEIALTPNAPDQVRSWVRTWNLTKLNVPGRYLPVPANLCAAEISPDGKTIAIGGTESIVRDENGREIPSSPEDADVQLLAADSGSELARIHNDSGVIAAIRFSHSGRFLAVLTPWTGRLRVWEVANRRLMLDIETPPGRPPFEFSPDDALLLSVSPKPVGIELDVWDIAKRKRIETLAEPDDSDAKGYSALALGADNQTLFVGTDNGPIIVWNIRTKKRLRVLKGHTFSVMVLRLSAGGRTLVSGGVDGDLFVWEAPTGRKIWSASGHAGMVLSVGFVAGGRELLSAGADGAMRLWDTPTGRPLLSMFSIGTEDWLAVAPDGLFDGTAAGMRTVAWRRPGSAETSTLDAFFTDFFRPGLVADVIAGKRPRASIDIATLIQIPGLRSMLSATPKLARVEARNGQVRVCFAQEPGVAIEVTPGDRRVVVPPINGYHLNRGSASCPYWKDLPDPNSGLLLKQLQHSETLAAHTPWDGMSSVASRATLHVLTVGISNYEDSNVYPDLAYGASSARAIEGFFRRQGSSPNRPYSRVHVWDGLYGPDASLKNILQMLTQIAQSATDEDVVFLYFVGHGEVSVGDEMFYFVPVDGRDNLQDTGLSAAMIAERIRDIAARRIILIVDACQSGGLIESLSKVAAVKAQIGMRGAPSGKAVGMQLIASALPLSYALGQPNGESFLTSTLLRGLGAGTGVATAKQMADYIKKQLPITSQKIIKGFLQTPLITSVGVDFPVVWAPAKPSATITSKVGHIQER
jgi:WD40 repeat protein